MTENMKKFAEAMEQKPALKAEMDALTTAYADDLEREQKKAAMNQKIAEIAAGHGITLTAADFDEEKTELAEEELAAVAGGGAGDKGLCACGYGGYGQYLGRTEQGWCVCPLYGEGYDGEKHTPPVGALNMWCCCVLAGVGTTG